MIKVLKCEECGEKITKPRNNIIESYGGIYCSDCRKKLGHKICAGTILKSIRKFVENEKLNLSRLPKWISSANIKLGDLNNSNIIYFEGSKDNKDHFNDKRKINSDIELLLDTPQYEPENAGIDLSSKEKNIAGSIIMQGEETEEGKTRIFIRNKNPAFTNAGYVEYHMPYALVNIFYGIKPSDTVLASGFVPLAILIHDHDFPYSEKLEDCIKNIIKTLFRIHNSELGDYYETRKERTSFPIISKEKTVLVLGSYDDPHKQELKSIRDYFSSKKYESHLLEDLPGPPSMSAENKARFWISASRFCIFIDRKPSGHLDEWEWAKDENAISALLRPKNNGSTWMMGHETFENKNIKQFKFGNNPLEVIVDAEDWAESLAREREKRYEDHYPWK